ncbi:MAG: hypothetical protein ACKOEO_25100, partial [Planctomycetaceae bacterium]
MSDGLVLTLQAPPQLLPTLKPSRDREGVEHTPKTHAVNTPKRVLQVHGTLTCAGAGNPDMRVDTNTVVQNVFTARSVPPSPPRSRLVC